MSDTLKLGQIIELDRKAEKDAIHVAVVPVVARESLVPGQHVGVCAGDRHLASGYLLPHVGIVDPFITSGAVLIGQRFWLYLYPGSITSLRHDWTHPAFGQAVEAKESARGIGLAGVPIAPLAPPPPPPVDPRIAERAAAEAWLRAFCELHDTPYHEMIGAAQEWVRYGEYLCDGGKYGGEYVPDEFWTNYQIATGNPVGNRGSFFSCAC